MNQYSESEEKNSATAFACFFSLQGTLEDRECFAGLCHLIGTLVHIHWHSCANAMAQLCHQCGTIMSPYGQNTTIHNPLRKHRSFCDQLRHSGGGCTILSVVRQATIIVRLCGCGNKSGD